MSVRVYLVKRRGRKRSGKAKPTEHWTLRWFGTDGKLHSEAIGDVGLMTRNAAETKRREKEAAIIGGLVPRDRPKHITLSEFVEHDATLMKGIQKPRSIGEIRSVGGVAARVLGGGTRLSKVTRDDVVVLRRHLESEGYATATIKKYLRTLRAMFNRAAGEGFIAANPFAKLKLPKTAARPKRIFSAAETWALREVAPDPWWRMFLLLAETTGLRLGELLNLTWTDISFDDRTLRVARKTHGKFRASDGEEYTRIGWTPKTYEERSVPLPDHVLQALQVWRAQSEGSIYLFLSLRRLRRIEERLAASPDDPNFGVASNLLARFKRLQPKARSLLAEQRRVDISKVPWEIGTLHDLRRTYGTRMARAGTPIHVLMQYLGHSKMETTATYYLAAESEDAEKAREALEGMIRAGEPWHRQESA